MIYSPKTLLQVKIHFSQILSWYPLPHLTLRPKEYICIRLVVPRIPAESTPLSLYIARITLDQPVFMCLREVQGCQVNVK